MNHTEAHPKPITDLRRDLRNGGSSERLYFDPTRGQLTLRPSAEIRTIDLRPADSPGPDIDTVPVTGIAREGMFGGDGRTVARAFAAKLLVPHNCAAELQQEFRGLEDPIATAVEHLEAPSNAFGIRSSRIGLENPPGRHAPSRPG